MDTLVQIKYLKVSEQNITKYDKILFQNIKNILFKNI